MAHQSLTWMLLFAGLFVLRVLAQLIQALHPVSFLPPFPAWHGDILPYPLLLMSQIVIILTLAVILWRVHFDLIKPNRWKYCACFTLGGLYFLIMLVRLILSLSSSVDHPWFSKPLPAFFHVILASFILALGHYIYGRTKESKNKSAESSLAQEDILYKNGASSIVSKFMAAISYPGVLLFGFLLYVIFSKYGLPISIASYAAVIICAALVTLHELIIPFRREWRPRADDIKNDAWFMILVQFALPYLLSITVIVFLSQFIKSNGYAIKNIWQHDLPVALQVCLMLLIAEFPRYWLHRAFHKFAPMWRFHAVHHSPHRLYWLNVGRFHPIDKAVQYAVDALPFVLMGLSTEVLGAYFIFYAINGFFSIPIVSSTWGL